MIRWFAAIVFMTAVAAQARAEASLFLFPTVAMKEQGIAISDVAMIEADKTTAERIRGIIIPANMCADGFLDRKEIASLCLTNGIRDVRIYGTGVRVGIASETEPARSAVKKGKHVRFRVLNGRIAVELTGTSLEDGAVGDWIQVKVRGSNVSRGRVVDEHTVEHAL